MPCAWARPLMALAPASTAAVPRRPRRDSMVVLLSMASALGRAAGQAPALAGRRRNAAARHRAREIDAGEPEIALRIHRRHGGVDALARLDQQREHIDL